jgi:hypothetical protein
MSAELHESRYLCREEFLRRKVGQIEFNWHRAPRIDAMTFIAVGAATFSATVAAFTFFPDLDQGTFKRSVSYVQNEIQSGITWPFEKIILALQ